MHSAWAERVPVSLASLNVQFGPLLDPCSGAFDHLSEMLPVQFQLAPWILTRDTLKLRVCD